MNSRNIILVILLLFLYGCTGGNPIRSSHGFSNRTKFFLSTQKDPGSRSGTFKLLFSPHVGEDTLFKGDFSCDDSILNYFENVDDSVDDLSRYFLLKSICRNIR